jgi:hypothetical protein
MGSEFRVKNSGHRYEVNVQGAGFLFRILEIMVL